MTRILTTLASLSLALLAAVFVVGLLIGNLYDRPSDMTLRWATVHRLTGTAAALMVVLVESIVVTYFIGTSRWCKEVVATYRLNPEPVLASNRLKRRAFAVAVSGMIVMVGVIALGAANDPATGRPSAAAWNDYHLLGAIVGTMFIAGSYVFAWKVVWRHQAIIDQIVADVAEIRRQRGLERQETAECAGSRGKS
jgi:uncharacterized membrane protein YciS (DUF1049 family)